MLRVFGKKSTFVEGKDDKVDDNGLFRKVPVLFGQKEREEFLRVHEDVLFPGLAFLTVLCVQCLLFGLGTEGPQMFLQIVGQEFQEPVVFRYFGVNCVCEASEFQIWF